MHLDHFCTAVCSPLHRQNPAPPCIRAHSRALACVQVANVRAERDTEIRGMAARLEATVASAGRSVGEAEQHMASQEALMARWREEAQMVCAWGVLSPGVPGALSTPEGNRLIPFCVSDCEGHSLAGSQRSGARVRGGGRWLGEMMEKKAREYKPEIQRPRSVAHVLLCKRIRIHTSLQRPTNCLTAISTCSYGSARFLGTAGCTLKALPSCISGAVGGQQAGQCPRQPQARADCPGDRDVCADSRSARSTCIPCCCCG
eukprot:368857-Pelagomonas_calceolata.AAC.4